MTRSRVRAGFGARGRRLCVVATLLLAAGPYAPLAVVQHYGAVSLHDLAPGQAVGVVFAAALAAAAAWRGARGLAWAALLLAAVAIAWPFVQPHLAPRPAGAFDWLVDPLTAPLRDALSRAALRWISPAWGGAVLLSGLLALLAACLSRGRPGARRAGR